MSEKAGFEVKLDLCRKTGHIGLTMKLRQTFHQTTAVFLFGLFSLTAGPSAFAGLHIEPYAGLSLTFTTKKVFTEAKNNPPGSQQGRFYFGPTPGLRLGWSSLGLAVGLDVSAGYWMSLMKEDFSDFRLKETLFPIFGGLFVSYKLPLLWRVYAVVIPPLNNIQFTSETERKHCSQTTGAKFGFSYLSLPFVGINIEYSPMYIGGENCNSLAHSAGAYINFVF